jgi:rod shape-determining protein MreD
VVRLVLLFSTLLVLHFSVRPLLAWRAEVDFLVLGVLLAAVRVRPGAAAVLGFVVGLLGDALVPATFGAGAFTLSVIGFAASWLKAVFFSDNVLLHAFFFFAGKWAYDILFLVLGGEMGIGELVGQLLLWSPLAAALTALTGLLFLTLFRGVLEANPA